MSPALPALKGADVVTALKKAGFAVVRIKGSHHMFEHKFDTTRRTVVPVHAGTDIKRGLLMKIIDDAGPTVEEFRRLL